MAARDLFHQAVRAALEKEGWTITHDPLAIPYGATTLYIDLGAERLLAAERGNERIAVEIKSYLAVPFETYAVFFSEGLPHLAVKRHGVKLIVYDAEQKAITLWQS
jgi:hypothetical protein